MATLSSAMRYATRDPDAHDPDRPSTFDAMRTALVVKDPIHHADIATHPLYGAATPAVRHAWARAHSRARASACCGRTRLHAYRHASRLGVRE